MKLAVIWNSCVFDNSIGCCEKGATGVTGYECVNCAGSSRAGLVQRRAEQDYFAPLTEQRSHYDRGHFRGKKAVCSVTTGSLEQAFMPFGRAGNMVEWLWPMHSSLCYVGFDVLAPLERIAISVGSDPNVLDTKVTVAAAPAPSRSVAQVGAILRRDRPEAVRPEWQ
ncbi:NAD(P)H-dependent oxidoreductase [Marinobacter sp. ATCH36]|nr:NAD(P)H-dependent oxidoreductase [Marinobacter sp. ATCH36]MCL7943658.1 NAD(P)H-dependent oxidoreductase [Marinobacter sp. ATCH36]